MSVLGIVAGVLLVYAFVAVIAYSLGRTAGIADADAALILANRQRELDRARRDRLAADVDEALAAFNTRPLSSAVGDVVPFQRPGGAA